MPNRQQRRAEKVRQTRSHSRVIQMKLRDVDSKFDIQVEGKFERVVMITANPKGRRVVEDLWPDVQWTTDEKFSKAHSADWQFTHIRVTRVPPHLEAAWPLAFAEPDALGFAVAYALHRPAWPLRVAYWTGHGHELQINTFGEAAKDEGGDMALFAEYMPPGQYSREPDHHA
jgi:hypothetical protein